jgi:hypothetical protein
MICAVSVAIAGTVTYSACYFNTGRAGKGATSMVGYLAGTTKTIVASQSIRALSIDTFFNEGRHPTDWVTCNFRITVIALTSKTKA